MANVGRVTRGYQIAIPRAVREAIGLQVGDLIAFEVRDGQIIMTPQRLAPRLNRQPLDFQHKCNNSRQAARSFSNPAFT